jgi:biopolymer transport protein ExbD/biopolymer transport protein TolR
MLGGIGHEPGDDAPLNAEINVTNLVDVALVLLIIFIITAPIMQGGVDVQLPRAQVAPLKVGDGVIVALDRNGTVYIDEAAVSLGEFASAFGTLVATKKPSAVYLRADARVPYGDVVRVLAIVRGSGVKNVGLVAAEEDGRR